MYHAKESDLDVIMNIFKKNREWFPHVRKFHINTRIGRKQVILEDGVVITYHYYTRNQPLSKLDKDGNELGPSVIAEKGDCILHQIVTNEKGKASIVLQKFFDYVKSKRVYLSVRSNNEIAIKFYLKNGMKLVGHTHWSDGKMPGDIFLYNTNKEITLEVD
jgi:antitoxin component YwqK of YwqJK toxin-antitoxin module